MTLPNTPKADRAARPAVGAVVEITVGDLLANGQGVGRVDGVVVFVWGPLPGERAKVRVIEVKPRFIVGELIELLERSADRVEPFCGVFGTCGGCQVQHLAYPAQLAWKRSVVVAALERIGAVAAPVVEAVIGMDLPRAYRNKMALVVEQRESGDELGFYQARSHDLVPIEDCPIVLPALQRDLHSLRAVLATPGAREVFDEVKHIVARRARVSGEGVLALTSEQASQGAAEGADALRARLPAMRGVTNSYEPAGANVILGRQEKLLSGESQMQEELAGLRFRVSVQSFFQVNGEMVEKIFALLGARTLRGLRVLDLYCGAGTFAIFFASLGATVVGFEENRLAVDEARVNAAMNGVVPQTKFYAGRVETLVVNPSRRKELAKTDVIFLDPPRKGSDETTLRAVIESGASEVWYLSCNPATLARDCAVLIEAGFVIERVQPFDMFPQTGHVEALAFLRRTLPSTN